MKEINNMKSSLLFLRNILQGKYSYTGVVMSVCQSVQVSDKLVSMMETKSLWFFINLHQNWHNNYMCTIERMTPIVLKVWGQGH